MFLSRRLHRYFLGSVLTFGSLAFGLAPQLEMKPTVFSWQQQAIAQNYTPQEISAYANIYLQIYGDRIPAILGQVENLIGEKPGWEIRCDKKNSITDLNNRSAIDLVQNFCRQELPSIIDDSPLTNAKYNAITNAVSQNPNGSLASQISDAMKKILESR